MIAAETTLAYSTGHKSLLFLAQPLGLIYAYWLRSKKGYHQADGHMANIVAIHLIEHLNLCGFVVMKKPPAHSA